MPNRAASRPAVVRTSPLPPAQRPSRPRHATESRCRRAPRYPSIRRPAATLPAAAANALIRRRAVQRAMRIPEEVFTYFQHPASYDTSGVTELLSDNASPCPRLRDYLPTLVEYARQSKHNDYCGGE